MLEDALAVIVDCTDVTVPSLEDLTQNSRDRLSESQFRKEVEDQVKHVLAEDKRLRELNRQRADKFLEERLADDQPLEDVLRKVMRRSDVLNALFLRGRRLQSQSTVSPSPDGEKFEGRPHPTEFRFQKLQHGEELSRNCHIGQRLRIDFLTDAEDNYFKRAILPGSLDVVIRRGDATIESSEYTYVMRLSSGLAHLSLDLPPSVVIGDELLVDVVVNDETLIRPFMNRARITVLAEQKRRTGGTGTNNSRLTLKPSGIEFPQILDIYEDRWNEVGMNKGSALRVRDLGTSEPGGAITYLFQVNMDNEYLRAERRASPTKKELLDAQWRYGLVLLGLGLLRDQETSESDNNGQIDEREWIAAASDAVGPVLLPLINELGDLDLSDASEK
ncbi:MAG: hypothetical protein OXG57_04515 [Acidimicrobiaceae bacterium]|nr:hypothetical protein [Acidimicrobiaceae bacterium]